jgi:spore coat protein CotF
MTNDKAQASKNVKLQSSNVKSSPKSQMTKELTLVNTSTVTDEMYRELMLFLVRCVHNSIIPYTELVEFSQFTCEFVGRKIVEIL